MGSHRVRHNLSDLAAAAAESKGEVSVKGDSTVELLFVFFFFSKKQIWQSLLLVSC